MNNKSHSTQKMVISALCIALCYVLPFLTGGNQQLNTALSPMHIPVFLCGYVCGPAWAAAVGFISPLFRSLTIGAPPLPGAAAMAFELAAYGLCAGLMYRLLPKKVPGLYATLLISMVVGRIVSVLAKIVVFSIAARPVTVSVFITEAFVNTLPGAALHLALIPPVVMALQRALPWLKKSK
ncbi:MAG: ECF transporter S component [Clostridia bacterium]|nr:ECF transporter S component [Clostridia bacterium]